AMRCLRSPANACGICRCRRTGSGRRWPDRCLRSAAAWHAAELVCHDQPRIEPVAMARGATIFLQSAEEDMALDENTRTELEAAAFRRWVEHLRTRPDVQNIHMINLAGFCRNCLSNWMKDAADARGLPMTKDESREAIYGMPFEEWRAKYQKDATPEQKAAFEKSGQKHWLSTADLPCCG